MPRGSSRAPRRRACLAIEDLAARVAELPLFLLDWPARTLSLLADLGVLRLRDALALPRPGLAKRFGPETVDTLDKLLGHRPDPRTPYAPPQRFRARLELPAEAESTEALLFPLRRLLAQMEGFLRGRGAGVQQLDLTLWPVRGPHTRLVLAFASPERDADFILALAREKLGRTQLPAPTLLLELRAEALLAFTPRTRAWLPGREEQSIGREHLVQKLAARLGSEHVFGIALADDHRPERGWKAGTTKVRALPSGPRPAWLLVRPQRLVTEGGEPAFQGKLALLAGPERIEAGWWEGEPVSRDYFVAANPGGETYWVYRDHRDPAAWYVHGVFS